tara:strand:+ start:40 stop:513 length:474 start_codon:yes stop_codon:yes gene_type:complete
MKNLLFVSALLIFVFSCKKERLNNDKEILVGTWELDFRESYYWGSPGWPFSLDTLRAGIETPNIELEIKKSGKVIVRIDGEEEIYKLNFRYRYNSSARYDEESFQANFYSTSNKVFYFVSGLISENELVLDTKEKFISNTLTSAGGTHYSNYFKRKQ